MALLWLVSTSPSLSIQSMVTLLVDRTEGTDTNTKQTFVCFSCPSPVLLSFILTLLYSFDLVTLGAMSLTLMFQRPPFLPQTRTIWTPNNNFLVLDQVTMSREEAQPPKCDIRSVLSPYPLVLPYPLPRYTRACAEKGPAVPELQVLFTLFNLIRLCWTLQV